MPWGINQVQFIGFPVLILVHQTDRLLLDCDASFPLQFHGIKDLGFHISFLDSPCQFDQAVCQCGLPVVNMSDNREIPNVFCIHAVSCQTVFFKIYL